MPPTSGGEQKDAGHREHRQHDVSMLMSRRRRRLLDDVDDDRLLLQRSSIGLAYSLPHVSASSASSASVRTPTPVAPFG